MIKITDDFIIDVDTYNYIPMIDKHKLDKKGNKTYKQLGYYSTLVGAILKIIETMNKEQFNSKDLRLSEAVCIIKKNNETMRKYLEENFKESK